jgi:hypothetical protein
MVAGQARESRGVAVVAATTCEGSLAPTRGQPWIRDAAASASAPRVVVIWPFQTNPVASGCGEVRWAAPASTKERNLERAWWGSATPNRCRPASLQHVDADLHWRVQFASCRRPGEVGVGVGGRWRGSGRTAGGGPQLSESVGGEGGRASSPPRLRPLDQTTKSGPYGRASGFTKETFTDAILYFWAL